LSRAVTTKSVRSVLHCEQRNCGSISGTIAAASVDQRLQIGVGLVAAGAAKHQHADIAGAQRGAGGW
jgi:hypothetical protein